MVSQPQPAEDQIAAGEGQQYVQAHGLHQPGTLSRQLGIRQATTSAADQGVTFEPGCHGTSGVRQVDRGHGFQGFGPSLAAGGGQHELTPLLIPEVNGGVGHPTAGGQGLEYGFEGGGQPDRLGQCLVHFPEGAVQDRAPPVEPGAQVALDTAA